MLEANNEFTGRKSQMPIPYGCYSVEEVLTKFIDLTSPLSKKLVKELANKCESAAEKEELLSLCGLADAKKFDEQIVAKNYGLVDLVDQYESMQLTLDFILHKCDTIMPRYYTIASSAMVHPDEIMIAISLSTFEVSGKQRQGLVSRFLNDMTKDGASRKARIFAKNSNFDMRNDVPLLMVGPGTGIVPFIAFSQERNLLQEKENQNAEGHLFFGCREQDNDFIYRDYLASMVDKKVLSSLNLAFSRPKDGSEKQYVQDVLGKKADLIERLLRTENGCLYICGATKMGADVQNLVKTTLGADYFEELKK